MVEIFLYPESDKKSRIFDEFYHELKVHDEEILVRELSELRLFKNKIIQKIINKFSNRISLIQRLRIFYLNYQLKKHKNAFIHFTTQLAVIPEINKRYIVTIHDLLHIQPQLTGVFYSDVSIKNIEKAIAHASHIITVSEYSKHILLLYFPFIKNISVIPPVIVHPKKILNLKRDDNHILFIGTMHPRKNLFLFLEAMADIEKKYQKQIKISLVTQLEQNQYSKYIKYQIEKLSFSNINIYNYISTEELNILYQQASVFLFPTLSEGFGMPPIEAQAYGCPVVASDIPICREVLEDSCLYVNPLSVYDITEKINFVFSDKSLSASLTEKGLKNAARFSIEKTVQDTIDIYKKTHNDFSS